MNNTYEITTNDTIRIKLPSNITTGYKWIIYTINNNIINSNKIKNYNDLIIEHNYITKPHKRDVVGVGGYDIFRLSSNKIGLYDIKLLYKRPWDSMNEYVSEYNIKIMII